MVGDISYLFFGVWHIADTLRRVRVYINNITYTIGGGITAAQINSGIN